jgi:hypothetical protein
MPSNPSVGTRPHAQCRQRATAAGGCCNHRTHGRRRQLHWARSSTEAHCYLYQSWTWYSGWCRHDVFFRDLVRRTVFIGPIAETQCDSFDDGGFGPSVALAIIFQTGSRPVPAGTSISCTFGIGVFPEAPPQFSQAFFVSQGNDPNISNNRFNLEITTTEVLPTPLPALGFAMKLSFAALSLLLGLWWMRRSVA